MYARSFDFPAPDSIMLIDEEFDRFDDSEPTFDDPVVAPAVPGDELAWDDQLDNGDTVSL